MRFCKGSVRTMKASVEAASHFRTTISNLNAAYIDSYSSQAILFPEVSASVAQGEDVDPEAVDESPDKLRGKYASPDTSPLKAEIKEGEDVLSTFDVS